MRNSRMDWMKNLYYTCIVAVCSLVPAQMLHAAAYDGSAWTSSSKDVGSFATSLANVVMVAVMAVAFLAGAVMVTMGLVGFAQKRDNPEAAQGAPRKLMAGGALLAITVILGVLKATLTSAG